jgi:hypothetical protein
MPKIKDGRIHFNDDYSKKILHTEEHEGSKIHVISDGYSAQSVNPYAAYSEGKGGAASHITSGHISPESAVKNAKEQMKKTESLEKSEKAIDEFKHHRLMAGYHIGKAVKHANRGKDAAESSDPHIRATAKNHWDKFYEQNEHAREHIHEAKNLHEPRIHGPWSNIVPHGAESEAYGKSRQGKPFNLELNKGEEMFKNELDQIAELAKSDRMHSSFWHGKIGKSPFSEIREKGGKYSVSTFNEDGSGPIHSSSGHESPYHAKVAAKEKGGEEKKPRVDEHSDKFDPRPGMRPGSGKKGLKKNEDHEPDEHDIFFHPTGPLGSKTSFSAEGKHISTHNSDEEAHHAAKQWSKKNKHYPNAWQVSDHGNHHLIENFHKSEMFSEEFDAIEALIKGEKKPTITAAEMQQQKDAAKAHNAERKEADQKAKALNEVAVKVNLAKASAVVGFKKPQPAPSMPKVIVPKPPKPHGGKSGAPAQMNLSEKDVFKAEKDAIDQFMKKNENKYKLLGSDSSKEGIIKGIKKFYYGTEVTLHPNSEGSHDVHNSKGKIDGVHVREHKGRWRFEAK